MIAVEHLDGAGVVEAVGRGGGARLHAGLAVEPALAVHPGGEADHVLLDRLGGDHDAQARHLGAQRAEAEEVIGVAVGDEHQRRVVAGGAGQRQGAAGVGGVAGGVNQDRAGVVGDHVAVHVRLGGGVDVDVQVRGDGRGRRGRAGAGGGVGAAAGGEQQGGGEQGRGLHRFLGVGCGAVVIGGPDDERRTGRDGARRGAGRLSGRADGAGRRRRRRCRGRRGRRRPPTRPGRRRCRRTSRGTARRTRRRRRSW